MLQTNWNAPWFHAEMRSNGQMSCIISCQSRRKVIIPSTRLVNLVCIPASYFESRLYFDKGVDVSNFNQIHMDTRSLPLLPRCLHAALSEPQNIAKFLKKGKQSSSNPPLIFQLLKNVTIRPLSHQPRESRRHGYLWSSPRCLNRCDGCNRRWHIFLHLKLQWKAGKHWAVT